MAPPDQSLPGQSMLEVVTNILSGALDAMLWVALWGFVAALAFLAFAVLLFLLRPFGLVLAFMWNVAVDIVRIVRGQPTARYR